MSAIKCTTCGYLGKSKIVHCNRCYKELETENKQLDKAIGIMLSDISDYQDEIKHLETKLKKGDDEKVYLISAIKNYKIEKLLGQYDIWRKQHSDREKALFATEEDK